MTTDRLERQQAMNTIAELKEQKAELEANQLPLPQHDAVRLSQHISQLDKQVADLAESNDELSTDLSYGAEASAAAASHESRAAVATMAGRGQANHRTRRSDTFCSTKLHVAFVVMMFEAFVCLNNCACPATLSAISYGPAVVVLAA